MTGVLGIDQRFHAGIVRRVAGAALIVVFERFPALEHIRRAGPAGAGSLVTEFLAQPLLDARLIEREEASPCHRRL